MADKSEWQCKHTSLAFACRIIRDRFGEGAVDAVAAQHMKNVRQAFAKRVADGAPNDMDALAEYLLAESDTHDIEVIRRDDRLLELRVTRCWHAEQFRDMNACDVGLKFMCAGDDAMIAGFNPKITLERPKIIMKGDDHCHFIYRLSD